jgi:hypothetical protein
MSFISMKNLFKKTIRLLRLILLIIIAGLGIGLAGGVPLSIVHKKESEETAVEWVRPDEEESEPDQLVIIQ